MNRRKISNHKGITLIALVISIIVMLILAGVSLNATIGDNGIITKAQDANYAQSIAMLEEFLQQKYVEVYTLGNNMNGQFSNLDLLRSNYSEYFYAPREVGLSYILNEGNIYFLIQKENLPDDIRNSLKGGDAGEKTYLDYSNFKDVYGVTSDLKVYYCSDGLDSMIGTGELLKDDPTRVAIASNSDGLADFLKENYSWIKTDSNGNILSEGLESIKNLSLDNTTVTDLSQVYNFSSLTKLNITNTTIGSLSGLEYATLLTDVNITNSTINDYTALGQVKKLNVLYLYNVSNDEVIKLGNGLKNSIIDNLQYFGILNSPNVTSIDSINNISNITKSNIKYMYMYGNGIIEFNIGDGFNALYELYITENRNYDWNNLTIQSISLGNMPKLTYLYARQIYTLKSFSLNSAPELYSLMLYRNYLLENLYLPNTVENKLDKLTSLNIEYATKLKSLEFVAPNLVSLNINRCYELNYISSFKNLKYLNMYDCKKINNLDFLESNKVIENIDCRYCYELSDISGINSNTTLKWIKMNSTKVGFGKDVIYDETTKKYTILEKNNSNVFYNIFQNKPDFFYLEARNCMYLGYVSYLTNNSKLSSIYLNGCSNISAEEIALLANSNLPISGYSWPRITDGKYKTASLTENSTSFSISDSNMLLVDFQNLQNFTKIEYLNFSNCKIYKSEGVELTKEEYNQYVNSTLEKLTNLKTVYLRFPVDEITFVKYTPDLRYLWMWDSGNTVSTHKMINGEKVEYENGLKLLNTYCPNLSTILPPQTVYVDYTCIQPLVNKVSKNAIKNGCLKVDWPGVVLSLQSSIDTFANCTDIEYICIRFDCTAGANHSWNFKNCTNLKQAYFISTAGSSYSMQNIYLPNKYPVGEYDGYELFVLGLSATGTLEVSPTCKELTLEKIYDIDENNDLWDYIKGISDYSKVNKSYLKEISIDLRETNSRFVSGTNKNKTNSLNNLLNCTNLEKMYFYGTAGGSGNLTLIDTLANCTKLKEIYFDKTNINSLPDLSKLTQLQKLTISNSSLVDISTLENCTSTSLTTIDFQNNSIYDLRGIKNLKNLITLNIEKNAIKNKFQAIGETVDNVKILNDLKSNYNNLNDLYIKDNFLEDKSNLEWAKSK